jgi:hypothetical protein
VIIVEVLGYGGGAGDSEERRKDSDDRPRNQTRRYGPTDPVRVFGNGQFTREQTGDLTGDERASCVSSAATARSSRFTIKFANRHHHDPVFNDVAEFPDTDLGDRLV